MSRALCVAHHLVRHSGVLVSNIGHRFKLHSQHSVLPLPPIKIRVEHMSAEALATLGAALFDRLERKFPGCAVAAVPNGAVPLMNALPSGHKRALVHLTKCADGSFACDEAEAPRKVVLIENVITTAGSAIRAAQCLHEAGYSIDGIVAVVDWDVGGIEALSEMRLHATCLTKASDVAQGALTQKLITTEQYQRTLAFIRAAADIGKAPRRH